MAHARNDPRERAQRPSRTFPQSHRRTFPRPPAHAHDHTSKHTRARAHTFKADAQARTRAGGRAQLGSHKRT
eukprot:3900372-Pleurochrysis_carterae.AAC.1